MIATNHHVFIGDKCCRFIGTKSPYTTVHRFHTFTDDSIFQKGPTVCDRDVSVVYHPIYLDVRATTLAGMDFRCLASAQHRRRARCLFGHRFWFSDRLWRGFFSYSTAARD
jgi:hypothetical protein